MFYFEVGVTKKAINNQGALTYHFDQDLPIGSLVRVSIGKSKANGVIFKKASKPTYKTKSISELIKPAAVPENLIKTISWMSAYYQADIPEVTNLLIPKGAEKSRRNTKPRTNQSHPKTGKLSAEQTKSLDVLNQNDSGTVLLHGVTGSGKTRVYIERSKQIVESNKGVIILVPEIGLTSQIVADFKSEFSDIFVLHSNIGESERHKTWEQISEATSPIVIGARSALFAPIHNLGLIVVDEEHETSYKQDQTPKYHAVRVASYLSKLSEAQLVLGSATPSIEDYYLAKERGAPVIEMKKTVIKSASADMKVIDLKDKSSKSSKSKLISKPLYESMKKAISSNRQVLLFHNRRGTATMVVCTNCGWLAECPNCLLPLTHHHDFHKLVCHVCNYRADAPIACPECKEPKLMYKGFGTKQIVEEARKLFPSSKIARFDSDTGAKNQLENRYDELRSGDVDIIVGTQMVAKGLDLPKLNVVGVILADLTLYLPDYSANERTYQLLQQVSGRVGRHSSDSEVIIQTYTPDHPAITNSVKRDYQAFYSNEISQRQLTKYPPFSFLLSLHVERAKQETAIKAATKLSEEIASKYSNIEILGPTPSFREKTRTGYRWQIVIKSKDRAVLSKIVANDLPAKWQFDLDPINLL